MRGNLRNGSNAGLANSNLRNDVSNARWNYALAIFIFRLDGGNVVFRTDEPCCHNCGTQISNKEGITPIRFGVRYVL